MSKFWTAKRVRMLEDVADDPNRTYIGLAKRLHVKPERVRKQAARMGLVKIK